MFSKFLDAVTPEKDRYASYIEKVTPPLARNAKVRMDLPEKVVMMDVEQMQPSPEEIQQLVEERQQKMSKIIHDKVNSNVKVARSLTKQKQPKICKNRIPFKELQARYLKEDYVAKLVICKRLDDFKNLIKNAQSVLPNALIVVKTTLLPKWMF